jgi:nucleoside-diphosphate-sugar epimerase
MIATRTLRRPRVLIVGCGDVGLRCVARLLPRSRVFALTSHPARVGALRAAGTIALVGDLDVRTSLARLARLAPVVLHLAPPPKAGDADTRTRALLAALAAPRRQPARYAQRARFRGRWSAGGLSQRFAMPGAPASRYAMSVPRGKAPIVPEGVGFAAARRGSRAPVRLVYASTTGVYGDCGGASIDETRPVHPANARAMRRVSAERQLRAATARGAVRATIARIPGIYAANRLPLARLEKGTPALIDADDVYTNHIHADDLAAILVRMATHGRPGRATHASDDSELKMGEYFDRVADAFGLARPPRVSRDEAEKTLDSTLLSFMRESRRLSNRRLKRELGVRLRYPDVDEFLRTITAARK